MDLTTRCPRCGTVFQANLSDLQLRKGYIRCVQCAHIFDGYAEVVSDAPAHAAGDAGSRPQAAEAARLVAPPPAAEPPQVFRSGRAAGRPVVRAVPDPAVGPEFTVGAVHWVDDRSEPRIGGAAAEAGAGQVLRARPAPDESGAPRAQAEPFVVEARPGHTGGTGSAGQWLDHPEPPGGWSVAARAGAWLLLGLLLLLLAAQALYVYRAQVARSVPALRPFLEQACGPLRCQVPYARDIRQIAITGSALKAVDSVAAGADAAGSATHRFVLQVTLRNQGGAAQEWPTLVLDLNDIAGARLVRRNLAPAEYLGQAAAARPFAAHSEVQVRVPLTLSGMQINGYQLNIFFP